MRACMRACVYVCVREKEPSGKVNRLVNQKVTGFIPNQDPLFCEQEMLLTEFQSTQLLSGDLVLAREAAHPTVTSVGTW